MSLFTSLINHKRSEKQRLEDERVQALSRIAELTNRANRIRSLSWFIGFVALLVAVPLVWYYGYHYPRDEYDIALNVWNIEYMQYEMPGSTDDSDDDPIIDPPQLITLQDRGDRLQRALFSHEFLEMETLKSDAGDKFTPGDCNDPMRVCGISGNLLSGDKYVADYNSALAEHQASVVLEEMTTGQRPGIKAGADSPPGIFDMPGTVYKRIDELSLLTEQHIDWRKKNASYTAQSTHQSRLQRTSQKIKKLLAESKKIDSGIACYLNAKTQCLPTQQIPFVPPLADVWERVVAVPSSRASSIIEFEIPKNFESCQVELLNHEQTLEKFRQAFIAFKNKLNPEAAESKEHILIQVVGSHDTPSATDCTRYGDNGMLALFRAQRIRSLIENYLSSGIQMGVEEDSGYLDLNRDIYLAPSQAVIRRCIDKTEVTTRHICHDAPVKAHRFARVLLLSTLDLKVEVHNEDNGYTKFSAINTSQRTELNISGQINGKR